MTVLVVALIGSILWTAFFYLMIYLRQTPTAKVRRRISTMINIAENDRKKVEVVKKEETPIVPKEHMRKSFYMRVIHPIVSRVVNFLRSFTPAAIIGMLESRIFLAGKQGKWNIQTLAAVWALTVILGVVVAFLMTRQSDYFITQRIIVLILGGLLGGLVPFLYLNQKIKQRKKLLKKQLPEFLDLLCVSVQAGLSFDAAVSKIVWRMKGTLSDEFRHMQEDVKFGMTKQYALTQLGKRCDVEEIYLFTTSIIQAEKLGTSMSQTLTLQSDNMRERHRQIVKAEAMKAPVKMLFPMVLFIFPSIFVVLLFPAVITLTKTLSN